jgi:hypothetical protein
MSLHTKPTVSDSEIVQRTADVPRDLRTAKDASEFLRVEHPRSSDAVWHQASLIGTWPKYPTPALRAACEAVDCGVPMPEAVRAAFSQGFAWTPEALI